MWIIIKKSENKNESGIFLTPFLVGKEVFAEGKLLGFVAFCNNWTQATKMGDYLMQISSIIEFKPILTPKWWMIYMHIVE